MNVYGFFAACVLAWLLMTVAIWLFFRVTHAPPPTPRECLIPDDSCDPHPDNWEE